MDAVAVVYSAVPAICRHHAEQFTRRADVGTPIRGDKLWVASYALAERALPVTHEWRQSRRGSARGLRDWL